MFSRELFQNYRKKYFKWELLFTMIVIVSLVLLCVGIIREDLSTNELSLLPTLSFIVGFASFICLMFLKAFIGINRDCLERSYVSKHRDGSVSYKEVLSIYNNIMLKYVTYNSIRINRVYQEKYHYVLEGSFEYEDSRNCETGYIQKLKIPIVFENMEELLKCVD